MFKKYMPYKISRTVTKRADLLMALTAVLSVFGTLIILSGGIWDATSHTAKEPDLFWTIQHVTVYAGVSMSAFAGVVGYVILGTVSSARPVLGIKILIIGSLLQIISGFGDSISHDVFGIDGLVSLSHQPLELGLVLVALGGFMTLKNISNKKIKKLLPLSIISFLTASVWLGFNLMLLLGAILMCIPVYEIFSSGCAVL